jgi:hypothetical protein
VKQAVNWHEPNFVEVVLQTGALPIGSTKRQIRAPTSFLPLGFSVNEFDSEVGALPEIIPLFSNADKHLITND